MPELNRRGFTLAAVSLAALAGCSNSVSAGNCEMVLENHTDNPLDYSARVMGNNDEQVLSVAEAIPQGSEDEFKFSFESIDAATVILALDLDSVSLRLDGSADYAQ